MRLSVKGDSDTSSEDEKVEELCTFDEALHLAKKTKSQNNCKSRSSSKRKFWLASIGTRFIGSFVSSSC